MNEEVRKVVDEFSENLRKQLKENYIGMLPIRAVPKWFRWVRRHPDIYMKLSKYFPFKQLNKRWTDKYCAEAKYQIKEYYDNLKCSFDRSGEYRARIVEEKCTGTTIVIDITIPLNYPPEIKIEKGT